MDNLVNKEVSELKKELRKKILIARNEIVRIGTKEIEQEVISKLLSHPNFIKSEKIMVYMAFQGEINIDPLIEIAWQLKKKIFLPKVYPKLKEMKGIEIRSWSEIVPGHYGIREPLTTNKIITCEELNLMIIPGITFDKLGYRLGYGAGYYDKFLGNCEHLPYRIGITYDQLLVDELPKEAHDIPMREILTEKRRIIF